MEKGDLHSLDSTFSYIYSCDLDLRLWIKIGSLEGEVGKPDFEAILDKPLLRLSGLHEEEKPSFHITCQISCQDGTLNHSVVTPYKSFSSRWSWNEWVELPVRICDMPRDAELRFQISDSFGPRGLSQIGSAQISLFGKNGLLREGIYDLQVLKPGDESMTSSLTEMNRLAKVVWLWTKLISCGTQWLVKMHHRGGIPKVDWMDRLTFREIEMVNEKEKRHSNHIYLMIQFPSFEVDRKPCGVVYYEPDGDDVYPVPSHSFHVDDPELLLDNVVENKHQKLARSLRSGLSDRDLKPNASIRDALHIMCLYPPTKPLAAEEEDLLWKFRFYLVSNKKALSKFLQCVPWTMPEASKQACDLLLKWAPVNPEDALEFLTPRFHQQAVRRYAVARLNQAPDDVSSSCVSFSLNSMCIALDSFQAILISFQDLQLYLLQLVQALKYENYDVIKSCLVSSSSPVSTLGHVGEGSEKEESGDEGGEKKDEEKERYEGIDEDQDLDLASFLIRRASNNTALANYLYWYLMVECEEGGGEGGKVEEASPQSMYITVMKRFSQSLIQGIFLLMKAVRLLLQEHRWRRTMLSRQQKFVDRLVVILRNLAKEGGNRKKKIERLQGILGDSESHRCILSSSDPLPFPLEPNELVLYYSSLMPAKLAFSMVDGGEFVAIMKQGDDLRQDQLILQMISLMDKLLRRDNLDLKLTPYRVLATSTKHGFVQFIESVPIAEALTLDGSIQGYLRRHNPSDSGPYGISADVLDNYVRSCAGYCVITYLLGVGDRHLDNLLLTRNGKMFHIDFGYILGRDPKPMPPPMKLSREMVEAMGGLSSEHYQQFRKQAYIAFLSLRRHANLILNLFSLMVDASVPDITLEPDKTLRKVQEKFRLDLTEEEAIQYLQGVIDVSVSSVMPVLVEQIHKFAQYWRK
ncbi:unnamed protein product [Darwinula stevensoni]|uniref:Phosphatidylinositol 3-kinase catalytic subunit type 3 n=1 Tax=Darwinula stevensoni TaxID=69355 RepID=A0A7R9A3Y0_9CRUS|nr:unnamed protein product [Darwinula stevensoni]CAG0883100.1 unnamed protein product [Darwinula stevensoni]